MNVINSICFTPDGTVVSAASDGKINFWNSSDGDLKFTLKGYSKQVHSLAVSSDGAMLASGAVDGTVKLWNLKSLQSPEGILHGHDHPPNRLDISPDGQLLASADFRGGIIVWDVASEEAVTRIRHGLRAYDVCLLPDGDTLVSAGLDGSVWVWDVRMGQPKGEFARVEADGGAADCGACRFRRKWATRRTGT